MSIRHSILRPFYSWADWLCFQHSGLCGAKWLSVVGGAVFVGVSCWLGDGVNFTAEKGVLHQVNSLLQVLAPFFMTALAVIIGFERKALDELMGGVPPTDCDGEPLTRRRFLGGLFGYLTAASIVVYTIGAVAMVWAASGADTKLIFDDLRQVRWLVVILKFVYGIMLSHLVITTFMGLHFMMTYMSQPGGAADMVMRGDPKQDKISSDSQS